MEPPIGIFSTLFNFFFFFPVFIALLLLAIIKGVIFCPFICLVMTVGISAIVIGLLPAQTVYTYHCILKARAMGPVLKSVICMFLPIVMVVWPLVGIAGGVVTGAAYGLLSPIFATFDAVGGEGKTDQLYHCFWDGTWSTVKGSFTVVRDVMDVCFYSYFSKIKEIRDWPPADGNIHDIRLIDLPGAVAAAVAGMLADFPMVSLIALFKCPYMLFKGWSRLFHDLIGREGPFLETICVPFAGLALLLWPLAVIGAVLGSFVSGIFLGAYAGVIAYQESSIWLGLCFVVASLSLYDEYSNDVLDMSEGSCFPRPNFRKQGVKNSHETTTRSTSLSRPPSQPVCIHPSRTMSLKNSVVELKPLELLDHLFEECRIQGEKMITEGVIDIDDISVSKSKSGGSVIHTGLPAYCLLQILLRSANADHHGLLLSGGAGEISSSNRPRDAFFDWFLNPLLIIKDQIRALSLSQQHQVYLSGLVLFSSDLKRLKASSLWHPPPESERTRAELDALARRLRGITISISRYPTYRRRFEGLVRCLQEHLSTTQKTHKFRLHRSHSSGPLPLGSPVSKSGDGSYGSKDIVDVDIQVASN